MSRPALLLERELFRINRLDDSTIPWGISAEVVLSNIFEWKCTILGPPDTPWEGAILKVKLIFNEDYNEVPPKVLFLTVPFHPNVDMYTGAPCTDFLDDESCWDPNTSILGILLCLQNLIANPVLENPVNIPAYEIYSQSPRLYAQLCRDCVVASRRLDAGLRPFSSALTDIQKRYNLRHGGFDDDDDDRSDADSNRLITIPQPQYADALGPSKHVTRLNFDDYHAFWKATATSLPPEPARTDFTKPLMLRFDGVTPHGKMSESKFRDMVEQQRTLWYGKFDKRKKGQQLLQPSTMPARASVPNFAASLAQERTQEFDSKLSTIQKTLSSAALRHADVAVYNPHTMQTPGSVARSSLSEGLTGASSTFTPGASRQNIKLPSLPSKQPSVVTTKENLSIRETPSTGHVDDEWEKEAFELENWALGK
ncbi:ubiquitin-conjugating enzyme/RWD-like protein [Chytriomyces sp. MP71]|nr:ubiquitin-conjugating enzyme/RWD-like protein [Chytriomyces sp. MP71]